MREEAPERGDLADDAPFRIALPAQPPEKGAHGEPVDVPESRLTAELLPQKADELSDIPLVGAQRRFRRAPFEPEMDKIILQRPNDHALTISYVPPGRHGRFEPISRPA